MACYFSDCLSKSAEFCFAHGNVGFVGFFNTALEEIHQVKRKPRTFHRPRLASCVLGVGRKSVYRVGGKFLNYKILIFPEGKLFRQNENTDFPHNEFSITDPKRIDNSTFYVAQIIIKSKK